MYGCHPPEESQPEISSPEETYSTPEMEAKWPGPGRWLRCRVHVGQCACQAPGHLSCSALERAQKACLAQRDWSRTMGQGLWVQIWVWHKPSWRRSPLTPPYNHQNLQGLGKYSWRAQTELFEYQDPGERSSDPHRKLTQTCPWVSRSIQGRRGSVVACFRVRGTECSSVSMGPFEGGHYYLHYLHHRLASGQATGREHSPTHQ